jgi:VanZ family protein
MQKLIKVLFRDNILFIAISITLFIGYLSLKKIDYLPVQLSHSDKVYHAIAYFLLGLTWLLSFPKSLQKKKLKYAIVISCVIYGIVIEVLQGTLTTYRTASLLDILANIVGVIVAMIIFKQVYKKIVAI